MVYGKEGFIAWFYAVVYVAVRNACKNIYLKVFVHSLGVLGIIIGMFYFITTMPSGTSILGMVLMFIGFFVFLIPLKVETSG